MELADFPKLNKVRKSISKLKSFEFPKFRADNNIMEFVETISDIFTKEFGILFDIKQHFTPNSFKLKIFRVREYNSFSNINLFREHSYPPINLVGMGRCNFPKYPVFYCSNDGMTALLEVARIYGSENKRYCISKWEISPSDEEFSFQPFLQTELPKENHFNFIRQRMGEKINKLFEKKLDSEREKGLLEYLKFLHTLFITDEDYSISASLAHRAFYPNHDFATHILMYPSVQTRFRGINMAIHPNFVENNMKISRFYITDLKSYDPQSGLIKVSFSKYGYVERSCIKWKDLEDDDEKYKAFLKEDFGHLFKPEFKFEFTKKDES
jgi:hypothetical protein